MAKRGGFPGGGMPGNMANLMKQAQKMQRQSWWWRRRGIWRLTKRQENIKESIMCFTVRSRQCLGLDLEISN